MAAVAVGSISLQVMPQYSWAVVRSVFPRFFVPALAGVVVGGVIFPLWVAFTPSPRLSTWAFAAFGWSMMAIATIVGSVARRLNPMSLSGRMRRNAFAALSRPKRPSVAALNRLAEAMGQLVATATLPYDEGLRMVASYTAVLAARSRRGVAPEQIASEIRALGERAQAVESAALADSIATAVSVLGADQVDSAAVSGEARAVLTSTATHARAHGQRQLATLALDGLAGIATERIALLLPQQGTVTPARTGPPPPPPLVLRSLSSPVPVEVQAAIQVAGGNGAHRAAPEVQEAPKRQQGELLDEFVDRFARREQTKELVSALRTALVHITPPAASAEPAARQRAESSDGHDVLTDTVEALTSLLPAPQPASTTWPTGWQGHGVFDEDVQRLAKLGEALYRRGKHLDLDDIEEALEQIGVRLRAEPTLAADLPQPRTDWRYPPLRRQEGGISAATAAGLAALAGAAFNAGFDRRAMNTGRRLLASATASARGWDKAATRAYANALDEFTVESSVHGRDAHTQAGALRMQQVLIGLVAECDQLLTMAAAVPEIQRSVDDIIQGLTWHAPPRRTFATATAMLQTRLIAAGWPLALPCGHELIERPAPPPPARRLAPELVRNIEKIVENELGGDEASWSAAAVLTLWAHAASAARDGDAAEARRIADVLRDQVRDYDERHNELPAHPASPGEDTPPGYPQLKPQLRRIISAAARWCTRADPESPLTVPHATGPRTVAAAARLLLADGMAANWTYRGVPSDDVPDLITVTMADGSRRTLRDQDLRADEFSWGYYGSGPHALAPVLLDDILAEQAACSDCLGVIELTAGMVTCRACAGTGERSGSYQAAQTLLHRFIAGLSQTEPWERTRHDLLALLAQSRRLLPELGASS